MESKDSQAIDTIDLSGIVLPLIGRWKLIALCAVLGATAGFLVSRAIPKTYESTATIYAKQSGGAASALLQSLPVSLGSQSGKSSAYYETLLQSDTMLRTVIKRLDLRRRPEFGRGTPGRAQDPMTMEDAVRKLRRDVQVKETKSGGINIVTRAHSPRLAYEIGETMLDVLGELVETTSDRKVQFISAKLHETSHDLGKAEDDMRAFMEAHDIAEVESQTKAMIEEISVLDGRLLELDVELEQLRSRLANSGELDTLVDDEVRKKEVESARDHVVAQRERLQKSIEELPAIGTEYARLQRRIAVLSKTFEILTQQYQLERITQQGEDGDYQIIDRPVPVKRKVAPRGSVFAAFGGMLGFALAAVVACAIKPTRKYRKVH